MMKLIDAILNIGFIKKILEIPIFKKFLNRETINYLIFGVLTTIVNYVVYVAIMYLSGMSEADDGYQMLINIAVLISWVFAVAFAYITNKLYVFESKSFEFKIVVKECIAFVAARLFSLGCEVVWMNIVVSLGMNDKIAKILANVFIIIMNYFFSKFFIFKEKQKKEV